MKINKRVKGTHLHYTRMLISLVLSVANQKKKVSVNDEMRLFMVVGSMMLRYRNDAVDKREGSGG